MGRRARSERMVRDWQSGVLDMVRTEGGDKRTTARFLAYGVNGLSVALMVVVFASTGGVTGAEVGIAGGSAGVGVLLLATIPGQAEAIGALLVLALGTAISMAAVSSAFGYAITRGPVLRRMLAFAPAMGVMTLAFGGWYALGAVGAVPYLL